MGAALSCSRRGSIGAPYPENEDKRLCRLEAIQPAFAEDSDYFLDELVEVVAAIFTMKIVLVSLVYEDVQWFRARHGLEADHTDRSSSFCAWTLFPEKASVLQVPDARQDERFAENVLVTGPPNIRFYLGAPLITPDGFRLGSLCLIDDRPHKASVTQMKALLNCSEMVTNQLMRSARVRTASAKDGSSPRPIESDETEPALMIVDCLDAANPLLVWSNLVWSRLAGETRPMFKDLQSSIAPQCPGGFDEVKAELKKCMDDASHTYSFEVQKAGRSFTCHAQSVAAVMETKHDVVLTDEARAAGNCHSLPWNGKIALLTLRE